jgi:hypothetical protein
MICITLIYSEEKQFFQSLNQITLSLILIFLISGSNFLTNDSRNAGDYFVLGDNICKLCFLIYALITIILKISQKGSENRTFHTSFKLLNERDLNYKFFSLFLRGKPQSLSTGY